VPAVYQWHTCVSRRSSTHEQKDPEVRGRVNIANQSGSVVLSQGPRPPTVHIPRGSLNRYHHESPRRLLLRPSSTHSNPSRQTSSSSTEPHHRRAHLIADPVHCGNSLSVCSSPQPRFALTYRIFLMPATPLPEYHCYLPVLVFPDQGLNYFGLESSRVFSVRFPELSLFQLSELLHFIDFHKKFIKIQNQFCLNL
jgi:hypothetical protein